MEELANFKIFLVDDDPFCRAMYERHIRNLGYTDVHTFSNGTNVLQHLDCNPDVIFLDYIMGDMNGVELLRKIRELNKQVYVVVLSGRGSLDLITTQSDFGVFDFIRKGELDSQKMQYVLEQILEIQKML